MKTSKNKAIKVSIPEPCHENWAEMTPTEKGKFCGVCTKEVINFSTQSDEQIMKHLHKNDNLCGRFSKSQLDREIKLERKRGLHIATYAASLLVPLTLLSNNVQASSNNANKTYTSLGIGSLHPKKDEIKVNEKETTISQNLNNNEITISGTVNDDSGLPLPGANVIIKGTVNGTQTDFDGNYSVNAPIGSVIIFSYVGFEDKEITVSNTNNKIDVQLNYSDDVLGGLIVVGYYHHDISDEILGYKKSIPVHNPERDAWRAKIKKAAQNTWAYKKIKSARKKEARKAKRAARKK